MEATKSRKHMPIIQTSENNPLRIAEVRPRPDHGRIGITLCPGKKDDDGAFGRHDRNLAVDLDAVRDWGAAAVVSLMTDDEFNLLSVRDLGDEVRARHMTWLHLPIRDGHSPAEDTFESAWKYAGPYVRSLSRSRFDVLVHCRGGLGRAGTVAARLLIELGARPEEAIRDVRCVRPGAIETAGQERHVEGCRPPDEPEPSQDVDSIRDRGLGAFIGLAAGDAVGTTLEFARRDARPPLADMVGGGPFELQPGQWTDDTSMALALAESLVHVSSESLDARDLMDRFVDWQEGNDYSCTGSCFDIGNTVRTALERYRRNSDPFAGITDPWSAGNGSLMRLAPVALRFRNDGPALNRTAAEQSRTTHAAVEAVDACRAFAVMLADAISGRSRDRILQPGRCFKGAPRIADILAGSWCGKPRDAIESSGYVVHTLEAAIWSVARTRNFRDAVLLAANLADDADTTAAVTGQLAGALYGLSGIPCDWVTRLAWRERLLAAAERLLWRKHRVSPRSHCSSGSPRRRSGPAVP